MKTDRLQGIIFINMVSSPSVSGKHFFDKDKSARNYFYRILGYAVPGKTDRLNLERRYNVLQNECDTLIAADLFERLRIPADKIDILR